MRIVDMHCDTISKLYKEKMRRKEQAVGNLEKNKLHIDLEKLQKGDYLLQNFALFVDLKETLKEGADPFEKVMAMADLYHQEIDNLSQYIGSVAIFSDINKNKEQQKISALLTVEEGAVCQGDLSKLRSLYQQGVRMLTLTWNYPNELGYPNFRNYGGTLNPFQPETENGLTAKGVEFVEEMEKMGMIVDVSHLSDQGFYDVANHTKKPFVASHSNSRRICSFVRNLTPDMIRILGERGGVTGLNFCPAFLEDAPLDTPPKGSIASIVAHAKDIINIGGIECLGIGSDFDGIDGYQELPDASYMPLLVDALKKSGFTEGQLDKILGENVLRLYKDCLY